MTQAILGGAPFDADALRAALLARAEAARGALEARLARKLSGEALERRSGALAGSIAVELENADDEFSLAASSHGVVYAAIQEFDGKTAAREIVAQRAKALAFGDGRFAKSARHPGSAIPPRSYLRSAAREAAESFASGLKQAALDALRKA